MNKVIICIIIWIFPSQTCLGQEADNVQDRTKRQLKGDVVKLMKKIVNYYSQYPQEKVYMHLDNTGYFEGETIWFAAYVSQTLSGKNSKELKMNSCFEPTTLSKILYVELLNPSGDIVQSHKFPLYSGKTNGQIHIDSILVSGFYEIRAYTKYMMNWDDACAFSRVIPIFSKPDTPGNYGNPKISRQSYRHRLPSNRQKESSDIQNKKEKTSLIVHLFPEGWNLVQGIESKVAYTIIKDGKETMRGTENITPYHSNENITIKDEHGVMVEASLPEVKEYGCVVNVDNDDDELMNVKIQSSESVRGNLMAYAVMNEGQFEYCDTFTASACFEKQFFRSEFKGGVNEFVVFSPDGRILCDRLFFVYPHKEIDSISIIVKDATMRPCSKICMELHGKPHSRLSFSAIDSASCVNGRYGNLSTYMLLGSEIKGYIQNPEYYFEKDDSVRRKAADLLMMVQGWRRYDLKEMTGESKREMKYEVEKGLNLKGQLKSKSKKHSPSSVYLDAFLFNRNGQTASGKVETDRDGKFYFNIKGLSDGDYNLQIFTRKDNKKTDYWVTLDRHFEPKSRSLLSEETEMIPIEGMALFGLTETGGTNTMQDQEYHSLSDRNILLPTVTIKKAREILGNPNNITWYDESRGYRYSTVFYDCDRASDEYADKGMMIPTVYEWLDSINEFFVDMTPNDPYFRRNQLQPVLDEDSIENDFHSQTNTGRSVNIYKDGYSYKGRPIIWILNNRYAGMTNSGSFKLIRDASANDIQVLHSNEYSNWTVLKPTIEALPLFLDDVKSVYISEDFNASMPYLNSSDAKVDAVTVFMFTHPTISTESKKGLRKTYYQGYTTREEFEMNDYTVLPPMDDFRRTLYWNPDIRTDDDGKATIEFFNNSLAKSFYISAEGITKEGRFVVNE